MPPAATKGPSSGDPYCGHCGYALKDLSESSKCPECGRPLVEVLMRGTPGAGRVRAVRIKSDVMVFGWPLYHVALGPRPELGEMRGVARGVFAIGDVAIGGVAVGGAAFGGIAIGGTGIGLCSLGGMAIGALTAMGGGAIGGIAVGGGAAGGLVTAGGAMGFAAQGGGALGVYARGPGAFGMHVIGGPSGAADPEAVKMFQTLAPVMGSTQTGLPMFGAPVVSIGLVNLLVLLVIGMCVIVGRRSKDENPYRSSHARDERGLGSESRG